MSKFRPFSNPRKVKQARKVECQEEKDQAGPASMHRLTSGAWKKAKEVTRLRLPSGS